ncbi:MAG: hypothetical protein R2684_08710 [Pyrinomonadaceae bacterium]
MPSISYPKLIFAAVLSLYFFSIAYDPMVDGMWNFLSIVDLPIHETGHLLFRPFGEFISVAMGSGFQILVPIIFVGYFIWHEQLYSAWIVLFWVGQSILNVWVYAADAVVMQLVLTSGMTGNEGSFHDWNYLLSVTGLMSSVDTIAGFIRIIGTLVILAACALSVYYSIYPAESEQSL